MGRCARGARLLARAGDVLACGAGGACGDGVAASHCEEEVGVIKERKASRYGAWEA